MKPDRVPNGFFVNGSIGPVVLPGSRPSVSLGRFYFFRYILIYIYSIHASEHENNLKLEQKYWKNFEDYYGIFLFSEHGKTKSK